MMKITATQKAGKVPGKMAGSETINKAAAWQPKEGVRKHGKMSAGPGREDHFDMNGAFHSDPARHTSPPKVANPGAGQKLPGKMSK